MLCPHIEITSVRRFKPFCTQNAQNYGVLGVLSAIGLMRDDNVSFFVNDKKIPVLSMRSAFNIWLLYGRFNSV